MLDTKATILEYHKQEGDAQASVTPWQVLMSLLCTELTHLRL